MSTYYLSRGDAAMIFHRQHVTDHGRKPVTDSWRPVVVIDPDAVSDADLAPLLSIGTVENARDVLRAMLNPTPPEPEGLGAVVRDNRGKRWTRVKNGFHWAWRDDHLGEQTRWDVIAQREPVVLSEGVTA